MPGNPEVMALLALMLLHDSRRDTRSTASGDLVLLEEQDRSLWHRDQIAEGTDLVVRALGRRNLGPYQLQAAIAAVHAEAGTAAETDWAQIAALYAILATFQPSPIVSLNHAVAVAMSTGLEDGLALIDALDASGELDSYHLYHAARADLLRRMARHTEARESYQRALALATNAVERRYLCRRISELESHEVSIDNLESRAAPTRRSKTSIGPPAPSLDSQTAPWTGPELQAPPKPRQA